jgi:hypothetical protein
MTSDTGKLFVVQLDTRNLLPGSLRRYQEGTVPSNFFTTLQNKCPKLTLHQSQVAAKCGLKICLYFTKYKSGLTHSYQTGGKDGIMARYMMADPALLGQNNGAATFLIIDPVTGLSKYTICGRAYVLQDEGQAPLSKERVWGLVEMVNCLMDTYDMDPKNMWERQQQLERWAAQYKQGEWEPSSGAMGMSLYSDLAMPLPVLNIKQPNNRILVKGKKKSRIAH